MSIDNLDLAGRIDELPTRQTLERWRDQINPLISQYNLGLPGSGTVTSVSVVSASGVSGSVANATTTPAITIALGAISPTSVAASGTMTGSNLSGTNTGDQTNISGNAATVTTNANLTGDVTSVGNATTLTNAPVIAKVLTGYTSGAGTVAATDTILQAIQKLNGNDATNANLTGVITSSGNATSIASQTGTGTKFVVDTSPTLVTPNIGAATGTSLTLTKTTTPFQVGYDGSNYFTATPGSTGICTVTAAGSGASFVFSGGNVTADAGRIITTSSSADTLFTASTSSGKIGFYQTDGTRQFAPSYLDASGAWVGTISNHDILFYTHNNAAQFILKTDGSAQYTGKIAKYNNITTTGWGVIPVYASGRATAQTAANTSVSTYTVGAADGSFEVSANVLVTTATLHNFTVTLDYTDEGNTARTVTFNFQTITGVIGTAIANAGGAVPYEGIPLHIRCKASTAITVKTAGTFTTVTYNVEGIIRQLA